MDLQAVIEQLATELLAYHDRLREVVKPLSDEEIGTVIAWCRRESGVTDTHNFRMPEWENVASVLEYEIRMRHVFRRAKEHEEATGERFYCVACDGTCRGHD